MARVNHKKVRQLLNREKGSITDKQFFVSRILAGHFADIAAAQCKRYGYDRRVSVRIVWEPQNDETAHTDNSLIWINAATPIVKAQRTRQARYEVVSGLFTHELGHVLYTDFLTKATHAAKTVADGWYPERPACKDISHRMNLEDIEEYRKAKPENQGVFLQFTHHLSNIMEDGYIEERLLRDFPGVLGDNLAVLRDVVWAETETVTQRIESEEGEPRLKWRTIAAMILDYCLYGEIKYGETPMSDERIQAVFRLLDILDEGLNTDDARLRWNAVNLVIVENWQYIKPFLELCEEQGAAGGRNTVDMLDALLSALLGSTSEAEGITGAVTGAGNAAVPGSSPAGAKRAATNALSKPKDDEEETANGGNADEEADAAPAASEETGADDVDTASQAAAMMMGGGSADGRPRQVKTTEEGRIPLMQTDSIETPNRGELERDDDYAGAGYDASARDIEELLEHMAEERLETKRTSKLNEFAQNIAYGNIHEGVKMTVKRMARPKDELLDLYDQISPPLLHISKQLQRSITRQLQDKRRGGKQTGLYMGRRLDVHSLARDDGRVFSKSTLPNEIPELAIGLLLDESGSMSSARRSTYARASAIILYDFCQALDIPVMVYGHSTGSNGVDMYSYAEFDAIDKLDRYRMMDISARANNRDGAALRYVAEHLARRSEDIRLLILVSDGQPADSGYYGTAAEEDLRGIMTEYRRKGICFIAAAIGDDRDSIERIYGDAYMDITDLNKLPVALTNVVKRFIRV